MNIKMNEGKRQLIIKVWRGLSKSFASAKDIKIKLIKDDLEQLSKDLEQADISDGMFLLTQEQQDNFTHAYSYLGNRWKPQDYLTASEYVIYDEFQDKFF